MKKAILGLMAIVFLVPGFTMKAQQEKQDRYLSPELYQLEYFKFSEGNSDEAKEIIKEYFNKANRLAGIPNPLMELELTSQEYDYMVVWKLLEGKEHLNWQTCPTSGEWYDALVTVAGSEAGAKEIMEKYDSFISASKSEFAKQY